MSGHPKAARPELPKAILDEHGLSINDRPQILNRRMFCQLQVFTNCTDVVAATQAFIESGLTGCIYHDINNPYGIGVLILSEDPAVFAGMARELYQNEPFSAMSLRPEFTMFGRTYSAGREQNLEDFLIKKPLRNALNPDCPWTVWYPLRRKGEFENLSRQEQGKIMAEHSLFGRSYAEGGHAFDIRLACHGLDRNDNDFVLGLVSPELYILSKLVQNMRKTQQTSKYLDSLGPFFIGKVAYQTPHNS